MPIEKSFGRPWNRAAVIVAHPDDEAIWCGGTILLHPETEWTIITMCRASDTDRAPRFSRAASALNGKGIMWDLDDGPEQKPLPSALVERSIGHAVSNNPSFDAVLTHSPMGEYTRHRRHEEVSRAVQALWKTGKIQTQTMQFFAYSDDSGAGHPAAIESAHHVIYLPEREYARKLEIVHEVYGFEPDSFEVKATSNVEAFWSFGSVAELDSWNRKQGST